MPSSPVIFAIQLHGYADSRLGIVEFHLAADDSPRHHPKIKSANILAGLDQEYRRHFISAQPANRLLEKSVPLHRDRVTARRHLGKRELSLVVGGLCQRTASGLSRTEYHL